MNGLENDESTVDNNAYFNIYLGVNRQVLYILSYTFLSITIYKGNNW